MMQRICLAVLATAALLVSPPQVDAADTLRDLIHNNPRITHFAQALSSLGLLDGILDDATQNLTVFVPSNSAINDSPTFMLYTSRMDETPAPRWKDHFVTTIENHFISGSVLTEEETLALPVLMVMSGANLTVSSSMRRIEGAGFVKSDFQAVNGIMHIMDRVFEPLFFDNTLADLEAQTEFGPDYLDRVALVDVVDFVDARDRYEQVFESGLTQAGCRIRAFNRINDYYKQTINWSNATSVIEAEFLNATWKERTITEFIEYSLVPKNYYYDDLEYGMVDLIMPINHCAHMWVTFSKSHGLCFNNGCVVHTPDARKFLASNGVGYVIDKCLVCPGVAMLAYYAAEHTFYNMKDVAQFFISSEWNLRNLSMSVGDGSPVTLFAAVNEGWFQVNQDDMTRLATDKWKPHQWDFLRHFLIQGNWTWEALGELYDQNGGPLNLTSLAGQSLELAKDNATGELSLEGGKIVEPNLRGIDGYMHFIDRVPRVRSLTHSVYEMAKYLEDYSEQVNLIDSVFLYEDMNRLLPLTALFAPDQQWNNKIIQVDEIEQILENHILEDLLWCDDLRAMAGQEVETLNGQLWLVTLNDVGNPCFDTLQAVVQRSCVTKCDILARNGLVHEVSMVMLQQDLKTRGPTPPIPPTFRAPSQPTGAANRFPATNDGASTADEPSAPVSFNRPKKQYNDDEFDDDWSQGITVAQRAAAVVAALPFLALL